MDKPTKLIKRLPGQTLRQDLRKGLIPPLAVFIRAAIRLSISAALYFYGLHHAALVVGVMTAMMFIATFETHAASAIAKSVNRVKEHYQKKKHRRQKQEMN